MRVPTHDNRIVCLRWFLFDYESYRLLLALQTKVPNLLRESEVDDVTKKCFVPAHNLDLEDYKTLSLYNLPAS